MIQILSLAIDLDAVLHLVHQVFRILHLVHVDPVNLLYPSDQPLQVLLADQSQGQSFVVVPSSTSYSVEVDVEVDICIFF